MIDCIMHEYLAAHELVVNGDRGIDEVANVEAFELMRFMYQQS
jgi:hypothetical protein